MSGIKDHVNVKGEIHYVLRDEHGDVKNEGFLINTVTELHDALIADRLAGGSDALFTHMWVGTGTGQTAASTNLATPIAGGRQAVTSSTQGAGASDNDVVVIATFAAGVGSGAIHEIGIFSSNASGDMKCYNDSINVTKAAGDSLTVTWTITYGAS